MKKNTLTLNESQLNKFVSKMVKESIKRLVNEEYHDFRPFPDEMPEPFRRLVVQDKNGNYQGHLSTPIVWDGKKFVSDLAHYIMVDTNNIVAWKYREEI